MNTDTGCPECKMEYSFYFNYQFHKASCKTGMKE